MQAIPGLRQNNRTQRRGAAEKSYAKVRSRGEIESTRKARQTDLHARISQNTKNAAALRANLFYNAASQNGAPKCVTSGNGS